MESMAAIYCTVVLWHLCLYLSDKKIVRNCTDCGPVWCFIASVIVVAAALFWPVTMIGAYVWKKRR